MLKSMTAYGKSECQTGDRIFSAEIKSINNRYKDIIIRLPKNFQAVERELKSIISSRIRRGRIEVSIQSENIGGEASYNLELNIPLVRSYIKILNQMEEEFGVEKKVQAETFLRMSDVILFRPVELNSEELMPTLEKLMNMSLDSLEIMKLKEGEAVEADFRNRLGLLEEYVNDVEKRAPDLIEEHRNRLQISIKKMLGDVSIDENRLAQEVAFFAERSDITEEVVRIRSHLKQFYEYLSLDDALGRRLEFLIQELNREVNTLGTKASEPSITNIVVEMKAELEKMREQVQNVE
ncbi:MAG TPA: YicC family protein [Desulfobacteraceae bacterium]|nr:YicC family protein [Desulfobacteraceae bacterium]HPJ68032.1 YicC family protein [Desulfobacteraceae bacterium]HPQ27915.1 YicC family protein [Desulfobacteraceae bacterium]